MHPRARIVALLAAVSVTTVYAADRPGYVRASGQSASGSVAARAIARRTMGRLDVSSVGLGDRDPRRPPPRRSACDVRRGGSIEELKGQEPSSVLGPTTRLRDVNARKGDST